ncbi:MAG: hypothetical protein Q6352_014685 [Candidatus Freyrarchaeum guaymaensis]|nr:hypothetical protein [Candidatus Sigynarchaeota archaeon]
MGIYPLYDADVAHLMEYMRASNDDNTFENYLKKYVDGVDCHEEYLRLVGVLV